MRSKLPTRMALWVSTLGTVSTLGAIGLLASCAQREAAPEPAAIRTAARGPSSMESAEQVAFTPAEVEAILSLSPLPPPPPDLTNAVADNPAAARLGQFLFFDTRLSGSGAVSCATCHEPDRNWTDGQAIPKQFSRDLRHVPSLWNVAYNRWFYWDGRADTLWSQALEPLEKRFEHGGTRQQFATLLREDPELCAAYENVFGPMPGPAASANEAASDVDRMFANIGKAIAAYERRIVSRRAPFDVFVERLRAGEGAGQVMSAAAQRGLKIFVGPGNCMACHHGPNFTDGEFHDTGVAALAPPRLKDQGRLDGINHLLANPLNALGAFSDDQQGRGSHPTAFLVNNVENRGRYKTPTLRNVAVTPPYMHRGQLDTLTDVVRFYSTLDTPAPAAEPVSPMSAIGQPPSAHLHPPGPSGEGVLVPLNLSAQQISDLVAFLTALTDVNIDPELMRQPVSPIFRVEAGLAASGQNRGFQPGRPIR